MQPIRFPNNILERHSAFNSQEPHVPMWLGSTLDEIVIFLSDPNLDPKRSNALYTLTKEQVSKIEWAKIQLYQIYNIEQNIDCEIQITPYGYGFLTGQRMDITNINYSVLAMKITWLASPPYSIDLLIEAVMDIVSR
jgi:hypothetical protein